MTAAEPFASRWKRRSRTIPTMLGVTVAGVIGAPAIVAAAAVVDIVKGRTRWPTVRIALFMLQYAINDSIEIVLAPVYWVLAGFGTTLDRPASQRRHERLQRWSVGVMARRAKRLLGIRLDVDAAADAALTPGPVIVLCRHVNVVDASLPTVLYQRLGYRTRGVIMAELLADPGFDLIYGRTGSVFIPRDDASEARARLRGVGSGVDRSTAVVVFPEGRLFRRDALARALARLATQNPERANRLAGLRHVLPPRPGGVLALLDAIPSAEVVVIVHSGLERFGSLRELATAVPLAEPIRVTAWRVPAGDIPPDGAQRIEWLDEQWLRVDAWIADHVELRS